MTYRPTGSGRDAYIAGRSRAVYVPHDINARRDNLPDNVFQYLKEQHDREKFQAYTYEQAAANARSSAQLGQGSGKRIAGQQTAEEETSKLLAQDRAATRHSRLKQLYAVELAVWEAELEAKGLAIEK